VRVMGITNLGIGDSGVTAALELRGLFYKNDLSSFTHGGDSRRQAGNAAADDSNVTVDFGDGVQHRHSRQFSTVGLAEPARGNVSPKRERWAVPTLPDF